jgi:putative oxidoreductase
LTNKPLHIALWLAQILLALAFGFFGFTKATGDLAMLSQMMTWIPSVPAAFIRFIGIAEILGAIGMILPALTRIKPMLTPLAAIGFATIQVLAIILHAVREETAFTIGLNLPLLALALFVMWGRGRKLPIVPRAAVSA